MDWLAMWKMVNVQKANAIRVGILIFMFSFIPFLIFLGWQGAPICNEDIDECTLDTTNCPNEQPDCMEIKIK
jgi:hypothetical protein